MDPNVRVFSRASSVALSSPLLGVRSIGQRVSARGNVIIATNSAVQSQRVGARGTVIIATNSSVPSQHPEARTSKAAVLFEEIRCQRHALCYDRPTPYLGGLTW